MAKTNITQYSSTPSSNTDINNINIDENCPASGLNNAIRELMAHLKNVDTGSQALTALSVTGNATVNDGITVTDSGASPIIANRTTSDGTVIDVQKSGSTVGSIQAVGGDLAIGTGDTGLLFVDGSDFILPITTADPSSATRDNAIDLGRGATRFKNLYLSGGVYLGGTGSANYLDDYEEGTFTPSIVPQSTGSITLQPTINTLAYVKIGNFVHVQGALQISSVSSPTGNIQISLPFNVKSLSESSDNIGFAVGIDGTSANAQDFTGIIIQSINKAVIYRSNGNNYQSTSSQTLGAGDDIYLGFTYISD